MAYDDGYAGGYGTQGSDRGSAKVKSKSRIGAQDRQRAESKQQTRTSAIPQTRVKQ